MNPNIYQVVNQCCLHGNINRVDMQWPSVAITAIINHTLNMYPTYSNVATQ